MLYCRAVCNAMQKQTTGFCAGIQAINRSYKASSSLAPYVNKNGCIIVENCFQPGKKNFSTTTGLRAPGSGSIQDKERRKNYMVIGGLMTFAITVFIVNETIQRTSYDHSYIEIPKKAK